jgi:hypothetical protein
MERKRKNQQVYTSGIIQPRFPHIEPKPLEEVIQYKVGRKKVIQILQQLDSKFAFHLDPMIKPIIRDTTEPYEILQWYSEAIDHILKEQELNHNLERALLGHDDTYYVSEKFEGDEFYGIPVGWIKDAPKKYQKWLRYILFHFYEFGLFDVWRYAEWYTYEEEMYADEMEDAEEHERKEMQERLDEITEGKSELAKTEPAVEDKMPKRLTKPKDETETLIYKAIIDGLDFISASKDGKMCIDAFESLEDRDNGCLPLSHLFMMMDGYYRCSDYVESYICNQGIDVQANQVGITAFEIMSFGDEEIDEDTFDFSPITTLLNCVWSFRACERKLYG